MDNLLKLRIKHQSWDMRCAGMWDSTTWEIYEDLTTEIFDSYGDDKIDKKYTIKMDRDLFDEIMINLAKAKTEDRKVEACDGSAWSIVQCENGKAIWIRESGYIYGIKPLEEIEKILNNLMKELKG